MDADIFDSLTRILSTSGPRRRLLGLPAALSLLGGLLGWLDPEESAAKDRRRRRKQRHSKRKQPGNRKKGCQPRGKGKVCAGTCGPVKNKQTCGKTVDCGSCDCTSPCGVCFTCQSGPNTQGTCVPDPAQVGEACGSSDQVCQADGACSCSGVCANPTPVCAAGGCVACSAAHPCPSGQCCAVNGTCVPACPTCQACDDGLCVADASLYHTCSGPCASDEWCDAGACAAISATVRLPDCHSQCAVSLEICGQMVTCPACNECADQTGCFANELQDGPLGPGTYCSASDIIRCSTNADCAAHAPVIYCTNQSGGGFCAAICPF